MKFATLSTIHDLLRAEEAKASKAANDAHTALNAIRRRIDQAEDHGNEPSQEDWTGYEAAKEAYRTASTAYNRAADALADFIAADFH